MKTLTKESTVAKVAVPYRADLAPAGEAPHITAARTAQEKEINDRFPDLVPAPVARVAPAADVVPVVPSRSGKRAD